MDCCKKNINDISISEDFLKVLMKMPFFRYFKQPVDHVSELYERYADGLEKYTFSYVFDENLFYRWNFYKKIWESIGITETDIKNFITKEDLNDILKDYITIEQLTTILKDYVTEAPKDGQTYARKDGEWVVCKCGSEIVPEPNPIITIDPTTFTFDPEGGSKNFAVSISNQPDESYTIVELPSWLTVSSQTQNGFTLIATETPDDNNRNTEITVRLDNYPSQEVAIQIMQSGKWLSTFIFDVNIPSSVVGQDIRIFNIGTDPSFATLGDVRIDWEGNGIWDTQSNVPHGTPLTPALTEPMSNTEINVLIGANYTHTYSSEGTRTVTVQTRNGINSFKFAIANSIESSNGFVLAVPFDINPYITKIRKISSPYITNGNLMFYGVQFGTFDSDFILECPNINTVDYMFYLFAQMNFDMVEGTPADTSEVRSHYLDFPPDFWLQIANKNSITHATSMFAGSGFTSTSRNMLKFSTVLTSVNGIFRNMILLGHHWAVHTAAGVSPAQNPPLNRTPIVSEFADTTVFWDNPNISDFRGAYWGCNQSFGIYEGSSGYDYKWGLRKDIFKGNTASNVDVSWMFFGLNRGMVEVDFFHYIKNTLSRMNGIFNLSFNKSWLPISNGAWSVTGKSEPDNITWQTSEYNLDYRGIQDLNLLFPDNSYPNLKEAVYAFAWYYGELQNGKRSISNGIQTTIPFPYAGNSGDFNIELNLDSLLGWGGIIKPVPITMSQFLQKFPNATATSGKNLNTGAAIDGFYGNFYDLDIQDSNGISKCSDYNTFERQDVFKKSNEFNIDLNLLFK